MVALLLRATRSTASSLCLLHRPKPSLPPTSSLLLCLPPTCRAFHASPTPQVLDTLLSSTHDILTNIHGFTHLPWAYTLPLSALLIRLTITLPLTLYTRRATQQQLDLHPLLHSWAYQIRRDTMAKSGHLGPTVVERDTQRDLRVKRRELYRRWSCGYWKNFIPVLQLPIWLLLVETIRGMCGIHKGILGLIASSTTGITAAVSTATTGATDGTVVNDLPNQDAISSTLLITDPQPTEPWSDPSSMATTLTTGISIEPTLATEGFLWFPDLTAPDPLLILPFLLSASMFLNIYTGQQRQGLAGTTITPWRRRTTRALGIVALAVGPLTLQMPSAMLLYWVSSSLLAYGQGVLLERLRPLRMPVQPCKPGVRGVEGKAPTERGM